MMRIAIVTQDDPFYLPAALDELCSARKADICGIVVLPAFNERRSDTARRLYDFYGPGDFSRLLARYAYGKTCDLVNRLFTATKPYSVTDVARRHGVALFHPDRINSPSFLRTLRDTIKPDLIVSLAASQIFRRSILDLPALGCINLHSAPLPRYQGMMPNFWVMVHGEPHGTVTVHYMAEAIDAGDIILQRRVPIYSNDSLHDVMVRSKQLGVLGLLDAIAGIEDGTGERTPINVEYATYFSFPQRADGIRLRAMGHSLL